MEFVSLPGLTSYERAREIQKDLVEKRARDEIVDTVLFLEHSPVITRGRGLQWTGVERPRQMPMPAAMPAHFEFSESERGGDLTYHGPGQLVVYPIVRTRDIAGFLRGLENLFISEFQDLGLMASAKPSATGVWVGEQKVASIGIAIRKWVTYHGIAINVVNDLAPFHLISPCGYQPEVMTRLKDLLPENQALTEDGWRPWLEARIERRWRAREGKLLDASI